jgi:hypothetical protein
MNPPDSVFLRTYETENVDALNNKKKATLQEYANLLIKKVHFIKIKYTGEPIFTLDKLERNGDHELIDLDYKVVPNGAYAIVSIQGWLK